MLNFENNLDSIRAVLGTGRSYNQFLARSIAVMVFGSNDYINNYLLPSLYNSGYTYTPEQFANLLLNHYTRQILVSIRANLNLLNLKIIFSFVFDLN